MRTTAQTLLAAVVVLLGATGCPDSEPGGVADTGADADAATPDVDAGGDASEADAGPGTIAGFAVEVQPSGAWAVTPPGGTEPVLASSVGPRLATGTPEVENFFGAFRIDLDVLGWHGVTGDPEIATEGGEIRVSWALDGLAGRVELVFRAWAAPDGDEHLWIGLETDVAGATAGALAWDSPPDEGFFGLGTQVFGMDLRGGKFPLWTQEQGIGKPDDYEAFPLSNIRESAYAPMGVWHSSRDYSAVVGHDAFSELDLAETEPERVTLRSYAALPSFVLLSGATPRDRLAQLRGIVGAPPEPPPWVFAPWNDAVGGPTRLEQVRDLLRAESIPSSAIWSEDWIGGSEGATGYRLSYEWSWDPAQYPDLPGDVAALHARGFAFLAYFNTFVPKPAARFPEGDASGYLVKDASGGTYIIDDPAARLAGLVDLTSEDAAAWFYEYMRVAAEDLGVDGWMADFTEWLPVDAVLASREDAWRYHNRYPLDYQRLNRKVMEAVHATGPEAPNNWTFFARSGWTSVNGGSGGTAATMWGGDQDTDWDDDDGFPTIVPIGVHVGLSGVPIFGTDIAGYSSFLTDPTDKELFYRWSAAAAFMPLMRTHHGSSECANWSFDRDAETLAHYRRWAVIHTLLYPVFRELWPVARDEGLPMLRHPWLVEPETPRLWRDQDYVYFLGDDLLIAPVLGQGAGGRQVELPEAGWWRLFGEAPEASAGVGAIAGPTELPVYVRPGTALPLLAEPVDSFYGATEPGVTDLEDVAGRYALALYPAADGSIRERSVDGAVVSGSGWSPTVDWSTAEVDATPLPPCDAAADGVSCRRDDGARVVADGAGVTLTVGGAQLTIAGGPGAEWNVAIAKAAWGQWAEPTPLTEPDPDIPPPCE